MEKALIKALTVFKYLFILFSLIYWIGVIIDDWGFIEKYWATNWLQYLAIWSIYFLVYAIAFSSLYWGTTYATIFVHHKIIKKPYTTKIN